MSRVTVLVYSHRHGQDVSAYSSVVSAREVAAVTIETYLHEVSDLSERVRIKDLIRERSYEDAIAAYNAVREGDESLELHETELEVKS